MREKNVSNRKKVKALAWLLNTTEEEAWKFAEAWGFI